MASWKYNLSHQHNIQHWTKSKASLFTLDILLWVQMNNNVSRAEKLFYFIWYRVFETKIVSEQHARFCDYYHSSDVNTRLLLLRNSCTCKLRQWFHLRILGRRQWPRNRSCASGQIVLSSTRDNTYNKTENCWPSTFFGQLEFTKMIWVLRAEEDPLRFFATDWSINNKKGRVAHLKIARGQSTS